MNIKEFERKTIDTFDGLYARGLDDEVPPTHQSVAYNVMYGKKGELSTRFGSAQSLAISHPVKRIFLSTIGTNIVPLTLNNTGNLYAGTNTTPIFSNSKMIDFVGLNIFNRTYILPILNAPDSSVKLMVWRGVGFTLRNAGGDAPTSAPSAAASATPTNNIDPGIHKFAYSFVTDTGYVTVPSPAISFNSAGDYQITISGIAIGPSYVTQRQIFVTKSNLDLYFYLITIPDNSTTSITVDFSDTDLAVNVDNLFDLVSVPHALGLGDIDKYHGRMIVFGGENDLVRVSDSGSPESFNNVTGYLQIPTENDGNVVGATFQQSDNLYFTKMPGIYSVSDNGDNPSSWTIIPIEGGCGALGYGVSSITSSQAALPSNNFSLLADLDGLFLFAGSVQRPALTWKISDLWKSIVTLNTITKITVFVDPFSERFYVSVGTSAYILVGDFSQGWAADTIRWAVWVMPNNVSCIAMGTIPDAEFVYCLRIGYSTVNGLDKMHEGIYTDSGTSISANVRFPLMEFSQGSLNQFRGIRYRATKVGGTGTTALVMRLYDEGGNLIVSPPNVMIPIGAAQDYMRQINVLKEKMALDLIFTTNDGAIKIQRVDFFGKALYASRPQ